MQFIDSFVNARSAIGRQRAQLRAERFGRTHSITDHDPPEMIVEDDVEADAPPVAYHLLYQDSRGAISARCVTVRSLQDEFGEVRLRAFCHLRRQLRSFITSRIVEATDLATGEVHEDAYEHFNTHPLIRPMSADTLASMSPALLAVHGCRDELILLTFVAASDGEIAEEEQDQLVAHLLDHACDPDLSEAEARRRVRAFIPDEAAFHRALRRMCGGSGDPRALMRRLRRLVDADGELDPEEVAFVNNIQSSLAAAGRL